MRIDPTAVFVAEDEPNLRALLEIAVRRAGHDVVACAGGEQLLDRLRDARDRGPLPVLVVSDNRMPGCTGIEVVEAARSWGLQVPFVLVSGFLDAELRQRSARSGVSALLGKPVTLVEVTRTVVRFARQTRVIGDQRCRWCGEAITEPGCPDCEPTGRLVLDPDADDPYAVLGGSD